MESSPTTVTQNYKVPSTSKISVDKLLRVGCYDLEKTIGKGNFAIVKLASHIVTKTKVAIKIIDKTCLNDEYLAKTYREISILKTLRHRHITRLYEVMQSETMIYLVTEYAPNGEIFDHLVENGRMKEPEAARVFTQLVLAVQYCHSKGVVHRDLKAENVLLDKDMNIKLADFGFSNHYEDGSPLTTWCGSPPYAAPEVFQGLEYDGPKADIWSLGVVLYALVCGALPFDGKTLLELKSRVVTGKFRIPYFMSQDCEHLIRNMLVVEPDRRYNLKQIIKHRWLSEWIEEVEYECQQATKIFASYSSLVVHSQNASGLISDCSMPVTTSIPNLDSVVVSHMLQLSGLTADKIAQSVHEDRFDNIYAIYYLLYDKLQHRRRQHQKIQQHANRVRSRTSITTGVVDRSEPVHQETIDRLSPLCGNSSTLIEAQDQWMDYPVDLEKFSDIELECLQGHSENPGQTQLCSNQSYSGGNNSTRRHTVGPGDVAHEHALQDQNVVPLNFKYEPSKTQQQTYPYPPINLPMLQNQPLHYLTIKDQHLLKPPLAMGATGSFNRRASDGGANLPYSFTSVQQSLSIETHRAQNDPYYRNPNAKLNNEIMAANVNKHNLPETPNQCINPEDASEEIERYMQVRGCSKRHTVGCTDDLSHNPVDQQRFNQPNSHIATQTATTGVVPASNQGAPSGMRTRRTGLLTVTERPPVICPELIREVESRMNRDYFPPALKLQQNSNAGFSQSPPQAASATYGSVNNATFSSSYPLVSATAIGGTAAMSLNSTASANSAAGVSYSNRRIYGKASKLPPVQEVGRYSPVRRASEGSKVQFQGPLQECQYLQKGIAQRHFLAAPSPPLQENSVSLPGSPIHGKNAFGNTIFRRTGLPSLSSTAAQDLEIPTEIVKKIIPRLEQLVKEQCVSIDVANKIMNSGRVPIDLAKHLGLEAHCGISDNIGYQMHQQQSYSSSVSPLSTPNSTGSSNVQMNTVPDGGGYFIAASGPIPQQPAFVVGSQSRNSSRCQSPLYASLASSLHSSNASEVSSVAFGVVSGGDSASCCGGSSPLHQITKGISYLTTTGGGSITRGTSAASEMATAATQPLDLSMDVCTFEESETPRGSVTPKNWFLPPSTYYDLKPLNLSPAHTVRAVTTPPASPNLCIIQEENANMQTANAINNEVAYADCSSGASYLGAAYTSEDAIPAGQHPMHPQICLTDVQGSEITLVALSTEKSHEDESDSVAQHVMPLMSLKGLIITEPSNDMPSITRGIGRKPSLETDQTVQPVVQTQEFNDRRGSDKSLGFSDDSLSNDSNNLSPCQEPSASSGFKSDSHSEIGDPTEGHTTPDSMCDSRRMSEEMCYEVPLSHECSNLDPTRILEMVKQTIDLTMPPGGFILQKASNTTTVPSITASPAGSAHRNESSSVNDSSGNSDVSFFYSTDLYSSTTSTNLSLEYSGGLQIEVQVCEGRGRDNKTGKGIKLRRISGDQFEYGKLCQHLISQLSLQQVGA